MGWAETNRRPKVVAYAVATSGKAFAIPRRQNRRIRRNQPPMSQLSIPGLIHRACMGVASRFRNIYYRLLGVKMTGYVWMRRIEIARNWSDIYLEKGVSLDNGVVMVTGGQPKPGKITIRGGSYINRYTIFDGHESIEIGRRCMIGPHCYITDGDHSTEPGIPVQAQPMRTAPVVLEDEVWLGSHVVVLPGVRIGRGAVIGASSVVTKNIPANAIAFGVPARVMRLRGEPVTAGRPEALQ